ncbi:MAG: poly-beta-hydroxybutyrate-responsive repressor [Chloroflexota bacterium]|nr:MAG: poly-beta-hydroxybutyrate-responsive repressor [Chloroflexota bacterium]
MLSAGTNERTDLGRMPKNFLASWLLLLLRNWQAHGYQLIQTLMMMGLGTVDPATVYRTLRQLESEGYITSAWDPQDSGAARRMYSLTDAGEEYLQVWAKQLGQYQSVLNRFFELYTQNTDERTQNDNH